ncbi:MAG: hypothetical protein JWO33_1695 [Caulobacteraceae bacterium]|nr:hypothetical protein [Caulobacteraceae bacterium]
MRDIPQDIYADLPWEGPYDIGVGYALITLVEPHLGREQAYNRWYEDECYFAGAMYEPFLFSGRKWVATRDLQLLRYGDDRATPAIDPITRGCYLGTYWITPGRIEQHLQFTQNANARMAEAGRKFADCSLVYTDFHDRAGAVYRDAGVPRDIFALIDPHPGLVLQVIDAKTQAERDALERWLIDEHLPARVQAADSPVELAMVFQTNTPRIVAPGIPDISNAGRRLTLLWFLTRDPREVWSSFFTQEGDLVAAGGKGRLSLAAPFIPCRMGTDLYVDQLR